MAACPTVDLNDTGESLGHPFVTIIQYGLYDENTQSAIIDLQTAAGLQGAQISGPTTPTSIQGIARGRGI